MSQLRGEISKEAKWNVESFFETLPIWEEGFDALNALAKERWQDIAQFKGKIKDAATLKKLLDNYFGLSRKIDQIYTYAHLRHDEDVAEEQFKILYDKSMSLIHAFGQESAWIEPEILKLNESDFNKFLESTELRPYRFFLEKLYRSKKHILSDEQERILAMSMRSQMTARGAYSALSNVDIKFPVVYDSEGKEYKLTQGSYSVLMKSKDRKLRENAFKALHSSFGAFENTICELINGQVQKHLFNARVRGYESCLEAALKPNNIPLSVYRSLIKTVRENLGAMHHYVEVRKKVLGVSELHAWDMNVPLVADYDRKFSYEEAADIVIDSVAPLGKKYHAILEQGIKKDRWIDVYESKGKRTGAYSSGCYDSMPYILLNFQGTLQDVLTLSHEAGHSMNSLLSNEALEYHEAQYPIFVAEVASTFNEQLTLDYLLEKAKSKKEKLSILNEQIERMRSTFFRQVMFAEFELTLHEMAEQEIPLTPQLLKAEYRKLSAAYFGPAMVLDKELEWEFLRIPHFYYNFYVYQYATGIAAAVALVDVVKHKGNALYLEFLASGGSNYPIELLKKAGVDMSQTTGIVTFIEIFQKLVEKFEKEIV